MTTNEARSILDALAALPGATVESKQEEMGWRSTCSYGSDRYSNPEGQLFTVHTVRFAEPVTAATVGDAVASAVPFGERKWTTHWHTGKARISGVYVFENPRLIAARGAWGDGLVLATTFEQGQLGDPRSYGCPHFTLQADGTLRDGMFG